MMPSYTPGIQWFIEYNPWLTVWGRLTNDELYKRRVARKTRLDRHDEKPHLAALGRNGDLVL